MGAQYPASVWDGTTPDRTSSDTYAAPHGGDWNQIAAEVIATETDLFGGLDASNVKPATNVDPLGSVPFVLRIDVADASATTGLVVTDKIQILDVWLVKTGGNGGSGDTVTLKNGSTAITDVMSTAINAKLLARCLSLDSAQSLVAASGTINAVAVHATNTACTVYILAVRAP